MWSGSSYSGGKGECSAPTAINPERERGEQKRSMDPFEQPATDGRLRNRGCFVAPVSYPISFCLLKEAPGSAKLP